MNRWLCHAVMLLSMLVPAAAAAHEFWMLPASFTVPPGGRTSLMLASGEDFRGQKVAFSAPVVAGLRHYSPTRVEDLRSRIPATGEMRELPLVLAEPGTHLVAFDTQPSKIVLPAEKFEAYLRGEGLEFIAKKREVAGKSATEGREHFHRNIKTLVQVGDRPDATYKRRTGQRLEIVPLANPFTRRAGDALGFQVLFDGKPLRNALLQAWHKQGSQTAIIKTQTDRQGRVSLVLPLPGPWMVSVVHMVAAKDAREHDWDSYWGNLTFALAERAVGAR